MGATAVKFVFTMPRVEAFAVNAAVMALVSPGATGPISDQSMVPSLMLSAEGGTDETYVR